MLNATDALSEDYFLSEESFIRDRIVVLGRRSSGKTVFLSVLYDKLWNSLGSLHVKALKGTSHIEFIKTVEDLKRNIWPPATQGISENILELTYNGQKRTIVALDYPGEVFTNAFVKEIETDETRVLLDHIDHAQGLIVLIDPEQLVDDDLHSKIDINYGLLQAVNRIQNWPDGRDVPIVLVLTKIDKCYSIIKGEGGAKPFIVKHLSQLIRDVHGIKGCCISAYNCIHAAREGKGGKIEIDTPLTFCLEKIQQVENKKVAERKKAKYHQYITQVDAQDRKRERRKLIFLYLLSALLLAFLAVLTYWVLPVTTWHNLWQNTLGRFF